jgi:amino acid adenylation domain-containing protein/thioester reductase-like protein
MTDRRITPVTETIAQFAREFPSSPAVIRGDETYSFGALNARTNQFVNFFKNHDIKPGDKVGICLDRTLDFVASILAVWKLGAIYVPLNRIFPPDRLHSIVQVTHVDLIVTDGTTREIFAEDRGVERVCLVEESAKRELLDQSVEDPDTAPDIHSVAAYIFSSGSTGEPKILQITHRALASHANWNGQQSPYLPDERCLFKATVSFAISLVELADPLANGAPIVMVPEAQIRDFKCLADLIYKEKITRFWGVTSIFTAFLNYLEDPVTTLGSIRTCYCTGEAVPIDLALRFRTLFPDVLFFHTYGTSEGFEALHYDCAELKEGMKKIPLGSPSGESLVYLFDQNNNPSPPNEEGRLCVGGPCLTPGYLNYPELNQVKFFYYPPAQGKLFDTGDYAYRTPEGELMYIGRKDFEVKIAGQKVHLGDVEVNLKKCPLVNQVVVVMSETTPGKLIAYVVVKNDVVQDGNSIINDLFKFANGILPTYEVPSRFILLQSMPLNPAGKIDRKQLTQYEFSNPRIPANTTPARSELEETLVDMWAKVLKIPEQMIDLTSSFKHLGGDSLNLSELFILVQKHLKFSVDPSLFNQNPTISGIVEQYKRHLNRQEPIESDDYKRAVSDSFLANNMISLLNDYSPIPWNTQKDIFLTGVTGFLGIFVLDSLLKQTDQMVYCLVKASDEASVKKRILDNAARYKISSIATHMDRVVCLAGDLSEPQFGLAPDTYHSLLSHISDVFHLGAIVHHTMPYSELRQVNVLGTLEVMELALRSGARFRYISTFVANTMRDQDGRMTEDRPMIRPPLNFNGYCLSKWCCETLICDACEHGLNGIIMRPGNITGRHDIGDSNFEHNHELLLLAGIAQLGYAPAWDGTIEMTPVDLLADIIVAIGLKLETLPGTIFNIDNPHAISWTDYIGLVNKIGKYDITLISPESWKKDYLLNLPKDNKFAPLAYMYAGENGENHGWRLTHSNTTRACQALELEYPQNYEAMLRVYFRFLHEAGFLPHGTAV